MFWFVLIIMKGKVITLILLIFLGASLVLGAGEFSVNSALLKVSLIEGDSTSRSIAISDNEEGDFFIDIVGIEGVSVDESSFSLSSGESKNINVNFDSSDLKPGSHIGSLEVKGNGNIDVLPLIFEIESKDLFFDANLDIPPAYSEIESGSKLVAQIKVFDLTSGGGLLEGLGSVPVDLEYIVSSLDGRVLSSESEQIIVNDQAQTTKTIIFPESVKEGSYVMSVLVEYKSSIGVTSQMFRIIEPSLSPNVGFSGANSTIIGVGIFAFVFMGIIFLFVYLIRDRDKLLLELKRNNSFELREQRKLLLEQSKLYMKRSGYNKKDVKKEIDTKVKTLKKKHKKRINEIKELKKKGEIDKMRARIKEWERQGYNTMPMDYKLRGLKESEMRRILNKWKKEYSGKRYKKK